jgi:hypothetical protein
MIPVPSVVVALGYKAHENGSFKVGFSKINPNHICGEVPFESCKISHISISTFLQEESAEPCPRSICGNLDISRTINTSSVGSGRYRNTHVKRSFSKLCHIIYRCLLA